MGDYLATLGDLGLEDEDIIDVQINECPDGGAEIFYQFTEEGEAIVEAAAARAGMTLEEYLQKMFSQQIARLRDEQPMSFLTWVKSCMSKMTWPAPYRLRP